MCEWVLCECGVLMTLWSHDVSSIKTKSGAYRRAHSYLHTLVLAHDTSQLQVAFDLLSDLLEAVHDGHGGDGMDTSQDVQSHIHQALEEGHVWQTWMKRIHVR